MVSGTILRAQVRILTASASEPELGVAVRVAHDPDGVDIPDHASQRRTDQKSGSSHRLLG
jgi:hypothetical protein